MKKVFLVLILLLTLVTPAVALEWTLVDAATVGGTSITVTNSCLKSNASKTLIVDGGAGLTGTFTVQEDPESVDTLAAQDLPDGTVVKYTTNHSIYGIKVTYTITAGTLNKIILRCK